MFFFIRQFILIFLLGIISLNVTELQKTKVRFATDANYYPFEYVAKDNTIQGFDIDIANAICTEVNLQCTFEHRRFDDLLIMLTFKNYDAVIAALDITGERLKTVDFSDSYYKVAPVFISREQYQNKFSLKGKLIGVQANTSNQNYLIAVAGNEDSYIIPYFSSEAALNDLQGGKIDAVFTDFAVVSQFISAHQEDSELVISRTESIFVDQFSEGYGIAVDKGNDVLKARLNQGLKFIIENGVYAKIFNKYFP